MPLVENIKRLANVKGMTIAELERKLNFGNSTIRKWSTQSPSVDRLQKVADYFNVSIDYLLGRDTNEASPRALTIARRFDQMEEKDKNAMDALSESLTEKSTDEK